MRETRKGRESRTGKGRKPRYNFRPRVSLCLIIQGTLKGILHPQDACCTEQCPVLEGSLWKRVTGVDPQKIIFYNKNI